MSLPRSLRLAMHRQKEAVEARIPYGTSIPTKVQSPKIEEQTEYSFVHGNPWDRFDYKSVLAFTGNKPRIDLLRAEFSRVGLSNVEVHWNFHNSFVTNTLFEQVPLQGNRKQSILNNALGHYSMIKTAYELGKNHALIMEDDIRFLRDVRQIEEMVRDLPPDYDIALLDSIISPDSPQIHLLKNQNENKHQSLLSALSNKSARASSWWRAVDSATSAACYALSRRGMATLIWFYEKPYNKEVAENERVVLPSDFYFNTIRLAEVPQNIRAKSILVATPKIARQVKIENSQTNTNYDVWSQTYEKAGAPRRNYGM